MIEQLQETLTRHAERVTQVADPYVRVVRRRRRRQRRMATAFTVVVLLVMTQGIFVTVGQDDNSTMPPAGRAADYLLPLLMSPPRGSLTADHVFMDRIRERSAGLGAPNGPRLPNSPGMLKVLFAGDLGAVRIAIVAGTNSDPTQLLFQGEPGDTADDLRLAGASALREVIATTLNIAGEAPTYLLLGPAGAVYERADPANTATGGLQWQDITPSADYLWFAQMVQARVRVRIGGQVIFEGRTVPAR